MALDKYPIRHPVVFLKIFFSKQMVQGSAISYQGKDETISNFPKIWSYMYMWYIDKVFLGFFFTKIGKLALFFVHFWCPLFPFERQTQFFKVCWEYGYIALHCLSSLIYLYGQCRHTVVESLFLIDSHAPDALKSLLNNEWKPE